MTKTGRLRRQFNILTKTHTVQHLRSDNRRIKYVGFLFNPVTAVYFIPALPLVSSAAAAVVGAASTTTTIGSSLMEHTTINDRSQQEGSARLAACSSGVRMTNVRLRLLSPRSVLRRVSSFSSDDHHSATTHPSTTHLSTTHQSTSHHEREEEDGRPELPEPDHNTRGV
jgi:hypothetical protein